MVFLINSTNVCDYLVQRNILNHYPNQINTIEQINAKNFNLLVTLSSEQQLLVKQERHNQQGKALGEFLQAWHLQSFLKNFPELANLQDFFSEILDFDQDNSILVFAYLKDYQDLSNFYQNEKIFPEIIAKVIGENLGRIHQITFAKEAYKDFFVKSQNPLPHTQIIKLINSLEKITPEIFGSVSEEGLKFYTLYQKFTSLGESLQELKTAFTPSCLIHNDLKLNNILIHNNWINSPSNPSKFIDLERAGWGDPAYDLGTIISSYLQLWLGNLVINKSLSLEDSLRLAVIPLENIQPSLAALATAYLEQFPEILSHRPDFLNRTIQFAGLALILQIQAMVQYEKTFGNLGIVLLQVAKKLLGYPAQSFTTIFGTYYEET
jgi:thiamine kinase-like enzyme